MKRETLTLTVDVDVDRENRKYWAVDVFFSGGIG